MRCRECGSRNDWPAHVCVSCGCSMQLSCGACGVVNAGDAPVCIGCGIPLGQPTSDAGAVRAYLSGEVKHLTVLFADLVGSFSLLSEDPEEAARLLEGVLGQMEQAVRAAGGIITQTMGDGIMALFGAPLASEDHAVRACRAAIALREDIQSRGPVKDLGQAVRVGICTGNVLTGRHGGGPAAGYTAFGRTAHLASRLEHRAQPGCILISAPTYKFARPWVEVRSLGRQEIRGCETSTEVFELLSVRNTAPAKPSPPQQTPFVARDAEMGLLAQLADEVTEGHGRAVLLVGDAGIGRSRLLREFTRTQMGAGWQCIRTLGISHHTMVPFGGILDLVAQLSSPFDQPNDAVELVAANLGDSLKAHEPALNYLLGNKAQDFDQLPSERRRAQIARAAAALIAEAGGQCPILLEVDDLQWVDSDSRYVLEYIAASISGSRAMLIGACRTDSQMLWAHLPNCFQVPLESFAKKRINTFLNTLLGPHPSLADLRRILVRRTGGNPLFVEEIVGDLVSIGALEGDVGNYRLSASDVPLKIPPRVQDVIAARVDRLENLDKRTLQAAAICGSDVEPPLLAAILSSPVETVSDSLGSLVGQGFLEQSESPRPAYSFCHALTQEVVYAALVKEDKVRLHKSALAFLERQTAMAEENPEALAFHSSLSLDFARAVRYLMLSGERALSVSACQRAINCFTKALGFMERLPPGGDRDRQEIELRMRLRVALVPLGRHLEIVPHLDRVESLLNAGPDQLLAAQVSCYKAHSCWLLGRWEDAARSAGRALEIAQREQNEGHGVTARFVLGITAYSTGDFRVAVEQLEASLEKMPGNEGSLRLGFFALPSVVCRSWLSWCLAELGDFDRAMDHGRESLRIAEKEGRPFDRVQSLLSVGGVELMSGDWNAALPHLEEALAECRRADVAVLVPRAAAALGYARALAGDLEEASELGEMALKEADRMDLLAMRPICLRWSAEIALLAGRVTEASRVSGALLSECERSSQRGQKAWALYLLGRCREIEGAKDEAAGYYADSLKRAEGLGMRPLMARLAGQMAPAGTV